MLNTQTIHSTILQINSRSEQIEMNMNIQVSKNESPKAKPDQATLSFGKHFTDHMFLMNYSIDKGWYDPRIVPYSP